MFIVTSPAGEGLYIFPRISVLEACLVFQIYPHAECALLLLLYLSFFGRGSYSSGIIVGLSDLALAHTMCFFFRIVIWVAGWADPRGPYNVFILV